MSFFSRIFGDKKPSSKGEEKNYPPSPEFQRLIGFGKELQKLLNSDRYLARSDYRPLVEWGVTRPDVTEAGSGKI